MQPERSFEECWEIIMSSCWDDVVEAVLENYSLLWLVKKKIKMVVVEWLKKIREMKQKN